MTSWSQCFNFKVEPYPIVWYFVCVYLCFRFESTFVGDAGRLWIPCVTWSNWIDPGSVALCGRRLRLQLSFFFTNRSRKESRPSRSSNQNDSYATAQTLPFSMPARLYSTNLSSCSTAELSPPQSGLPQVTTDLSARIAAKAAPAAWICCTPLSWSRTFELSPPQRELPQVTTDLSARIAAKAVSAAWTSCTPLSWSRTVELSPPEYALPQVTTDLSARIAAKAAFVAWISCTPLSWSRTVELSPPEDGLPQVTTDLSARIAAKAAFVAWISCTSLSWSRTVELSPPLAASPQATTDPSARIAAKAAFVAWICCTSLSWSRTVELSPPQCGLPQVTATLSPWRHHKANAVFVAASCGWSTRAVRHSPSFISASSKVWPGSTRILFLAVISLRCFCPRARWAAVLTSWTVEQGRSDRGSACPFGKATFIWRIWEVLPSWRRRFETLSMNLSFILWAQAKQENKNTWSAVSGTMFLSVDSPHKWWHNEWYLGGFSILVILIVIIYIGYSCLLTSWITIVVNNDYYIILKTTWIFKPNFKGFTGPVFRSEEWFGGRVLPNQIRSLLQTPDPKTHHILKTKRKSKWTNPLLLNKKSSPTQIRMNLCESYDFHFFLTFLGKLDDLKKMMFTNIVSSLSHIFWDPPVIPSLTPAIPPRDLQAKGPAVHGRTKGHVAQLRRVTPTVLEAGFHVWVPTLPGIS